MDPKGRLWQVLNMWHQDASDFYIDPYDVVEEMLPADKGALTGLLTELDGWIASTTAQQRYDEIDQNDWMPFGDDDVEPFLADLRARILDGIGNDAPRRMQAPHHLLWPRDIPEGPFPELLRLARYVHEHVAGESTNPFLSAERSADCIAVTAFRLHDLDSIYHERLVSEISRLRAGEVRDWFSAVGANTVWGNQDDTDDWIDVVEFLARYRLQMPGRPDEYTYEALQELRENAAVWPPIEADWSVSANVLRRWKSEDPGTAVDADLAKLRREELQRVLADVDLLLAAGEEPRERILDLVVLQRPRRPKTLEFLAEVRQRVVAALATM